MPRGFRLYVIEGWGALRTGEHDPLGERCAAGVRIPWRGRDTPRMENTPSRDGVTVRGAGMSGLTGTSLRGEIPLRGRNGKEKNRFIL